MVELIIVLVLILVIFISGYMFYRKISSKVKSLSRDLLGTEDLIKGLKQVELESNNTPYSVSGGAVIYLPMVQKDFPEYHNETMSERVKQFMLLFYRSLEEKDLTLINGDEVTETVIEIMKSKILDLLDSKSKEKYDNIKIHAISLTKYTKTKEFATVRYQISLEYVGNNGKVQTKYEVDLTYLFKDLDKNSFCLRCSHCGASLNETKTVCEYCGTIVVRNIIKLWLISNIKKTR